MRFRKSIKICKGLKLNLSKSGGSLTIGGRGASINIGKNGTYLNTNIPGTSIGSRTKLSADKRKPTRQKETVSVKIKATINDLGQIDFIDQYDNKIYDESLIRKVKRSEDFKRMLKDYENKKKIETDNKNQSFIEIYKHSEKIINKEEILAKKDKLSLNTYVVENFKINKPEMSSIQAELNAKAKREIKSIAFWILKDKRKKYVEIESQKEYDNQLKLWNEKKEKFDNEQVEIKIKEDQKYQKQYKRQKEYYENILIGNRSFIENEIENYLKNITLPVDFSIGYKYEENGVLFIDLDLPEIEDIPNEVSSILASGKVKIKNKTQKAIKEDYITCVCGLAFYFSSVFFNISTNISNIIVSGYTQRISKKTGNLCDEYIYSVNFDRSKFSKLNIKNIDPYEALTEFEPIIDITKSGIMKTINPISYETKQNI